MKGTTHAHGKAPTNTACYGSSKSWTNGEGENTTGVATCDAKHIQTPVSGVCDKLPKTVVIPIVEIELDETAKPDSALVEAIERSVTMPWGCLLVPLIVSPIVASTSDKHFRLRDGIARLHVALKLNLSHVNAIVVDGSNEEINLLALEANMLRHRPNAYQFIRMVAEHKALLQTVYEAYQPGGNKAAKSTELKAKGMPSLEKLAKNVTGLQKSAFYEKAAVYESLQPPVRKYLEEHPKCGTAQKERHLQRLAKIGDKFGADIQVKLIPYLPTISNPDEAYFQLIRDEAAKDAQHVPEDDLFQIFCEKFEANAKRIADGSVDLVCTDPNWHLAEESEAGQMWKLNGMDIAPQMTAKEWSLLGELIAKKLKVSGVAVVMVGQQNGYEIESILRTYLRKRWEMAYVHASGSGTVARKAGFASHWRKLLVFERKDAPSKSGTYKQFAHDIVPEVPKEDSNDSPEAADPLFFLKLQLAELQKRITEIEAEGDDVFTNDIIVSLVKHADALKMFHPWAQDTKAFREIIRRLTKAGAFVWEPCAGSGTTAVAAVTCVDRILENGKWKRVPQPRKGIGCDAMPQWAQIAKYRVWKAQQQEQEQVEAEQPQQSAEEQSAPEEAA